MKKNSQPWDYFPLHNLYAFTSKKEARKFVKNNTGIKLTFLDKEAQYTSLEHEDGYIFGVILLQNDNGSCGQNMALLAHECMHYVQSVEEYTNTTLDSETEAYTIQAAMLSCIDQIGEEWFTKTPQVQKHKKKKKKN